MLLKIVLLEIQRNSDQVQSQYLPMHTQSENVQSTEDNLLIIHVRNKLNHR